MGAIRGKIEALFGQGAPGSQAGIGEPLTDTIYVDVVSGKRYANTGTPEAPTWVELGGGSVPDALTPKSVTVHPENDFTVVAIALDAVTFADTAYTPGGPDGVGHTLTATANGALVCDGVTMQAGDRVGFLGAQASGGSNTNRRNRGVYVVTATGDGSNPWVLTRATDFDDPADLALKVSYLHATQGTSYGPGAGIKWYMNFSATSAGSIVFGTVRFDFKDFEGIAYPLINAASATFVGQFIVDGGHALGGGTGQPIAAQLRSGAYLIDEGIATLAAGTVTVTTDKAFSGMQVILQRQTLGSAPGHLVVQNVVDGVSFDIHSSSGTDDGDVYYTILH